MGKRNVNFKSLFIACKSICLVLFMICFIIAVIVLSMPNGSLIAGAILGCVSIILLIISIYFSYSKKCRRIKYLWLQGK